VGVSIFFNYFSTKAQTVFTRAISVAASGPRKPPSHRTVTRKML
jgi:hypothetical protein